MIARVTHYRISLDRYQEMQDLVENQIKPMLSRIPGVAGIETSSDPSTGIGTTIAVYNDRESLEKSSTTAGRVWRKFGGAMIGKPIESVQDVALISGA